MPLGVRHRVRLELPMSPFFICPQVYGASNVELITRTRTEHLSEQHKGKVKGNEAEVDGERCCRIAGTSSHIKCFHQYSHRHPSKSLEALFRPIDFNSGAKP